MQLKELRLALDQAGYPETSLQTAYRETTNQDIAASVIGYIRQADSGMPWSPIEQRVDRALHKILSSRSWTAPQRDWLKKLAEQTKANWSSIATRWTNPISFLNERAAGSRDLIEYSTAPCKRCSMNSMDPSGRRRPEH